MNWGRCIHGSEFHEYADGDGEYYSVDPDDGLTMNLGVNPLLQFGLDAE